jgi:glycosyltransferase involved in cell wall biosynthesis
MRVLHISSGNLYGGVEAFLATLLREAPCAPGMEPDFATCFEGRLSSQLAVMGRPPHSLQSPRLSRPLSVLRARRALSALLKRESYDVVVCHQPWACVVFGSAIRAAGFPVVLWVHMATDGRHWLERLCRIVRPDLALCNSRFTADQTSTWLPHTSTEVVYCPVSGSPHAARPDRRSSLRRSLRASSDDVVLVQVSRLEAFKGQHVLLDALSRLTDLPRWVCWIVGGAQRASELDYLHRLQAVARESGIGDRVRFTGERDDVPSLLSAADIYCQPNTDPEGFGLTFVEAMREGLPVVTSGIGGACEIVDGSCGVLTPPGNAESLATSLRRLIVDTGLRSQLGAEARKRPAQLCDPNVQMRRIQALLNAVVTRPRLHGAHTVRAE